MFCNENSKTSNTAARNGALAVAAAISTPASTSTIAVAAGTKHSGVFVHVGVCQRSVAFSVFETRVAQEVERVGNTQLRMPDDQGGFRIQEVFNPRPPCPLIR